MGGPMTLGMVIETLKKQDPDKVVRWGFGAPHSYRGYYEDVAFDPAENVTVGSMLEHAKSALGKTFCGWKGGDYKMEEYTSCWIAEHGDTSYDPLSEILFKYMFADGKD